ncbi:MAG TPA: M10 family metallopeptidase C-terminal domain-containing protein [Allosphingosinicella sp.]|nr:M10 family metallopeptidase C-terminal domain-containing protein [Allosphingosinicella sp.]
MSHAVVANRHNGLLGSSRPADVVVSGDGSRIYTSGTDGAVRVYDADSGELLSTWQVGAKLGGIDLSPDGSFLIVLEAEPISSTYSNYWPDNRFTVAAHKVDTATGAVTTFLHESTGFEWAFHDVAILTNGNALITGKVLPGWSAWAYPELLDTQTGTFTTINEIIKQDTTLSDSPTGQIALLGESNTSDAPLRIYTPGTGFTAQHSLYQDDVYGFNDGAQALSAAGNLVAQHVPGNGLHIYDSSLHYSLNLATQYPGFIDGVAALAFDSTGAFLFVLDTDADAIVQLDTSDWSLVRSIPVGTNLTSTAGDFGSRLIVGPDMRYFTVVTDSGLLQIDNPNVSATQTGTEGDDILVGTGLYDVLEGLGGDDRLYGRGGDDDLDGGEGDDFVAGEAGDDLVDGGSGNDFVQGGAGNDLVHGGDDDDYIRGEDGDDQLYGDSGNDNMRGGRGVDSFDGGTGGEGLNGEFSLYGDKVSFFEQFATQGAVADLRTGIISNDGFGNAETMVNIESLGNGTAFVDTFYGNDDTNALLGSIGDFLYGFGGADYLDLNGAAALADGGDGTDTLLLRIEGALLLPGESGLAEVRDAMTAGWKVDLAAGTLRDGYGNVGTVAGIENVVASDLADDLRGNGGDNSLEGGAGNDILRLHDGGNDTVFGGAGNDSLFFIGSLTSADVVNGGSDTDTLVLQGAYGALTLTANITQIENISLLAGSNTNFGEPGTNRYDYALTINDANFAAGVQARINGAALLAGEDFTFDGSAETNANLVVYGGKGVDTLTGGLGNDIFYYPEERFATGDTVNGGPGYDGMFLRGNYTIDFNAPGYTGLFTNIENLTLTSATDERYARGGGTEFDYNLTLSNAIVKPGETLTVSGALLMATETMILDASQEADGLLRLFGGRANDVLKGGANADLIHGNLGADQLTGNGGADSFRYQSVEESNSATMDEISDFTPGSDSIDLSRVDANSGAAGDQAFSWIGSNAFSGSAGQLRAYEQGGTWFVEGDTNGDSVADLVIALTLQGPTPLAAGDFIL